MATSTIIVNGKEFTHIKTSKNGEKSENFFINGVPVEQDEYNNELNKLKLAQMNQQEKEAQHKADEHEQMKNNLKNAVLQKLIIQLLKALQQNLKTLHEPILKPYLIFNSSGINSEAELEQHHTWAETLQKNLDSHLADPNMANLSKLAQEIENKNKLIYSCLKQSIQQATTQCDDTTILKNLLNLIEA